MTVWTDAQLSPMLAHWITEELGIQCVSAKELGLRDAKDFEIFQAAREAKAVVLSKDWDFAHLLSQHGPPPKVIWLTCGNTSNRYLREILRNSIPSAIRLLAAGESLVEITGPASRE